MRQLIVKKSDRVLLLLAALLIKIQFRARARVLTPEGIVILAQQAEEHLAKRGIPKSKRIGCRAQLVPACMPRTYRWRACSTVVTLARLATGWTVESVARVFSWATRHGRVPSLKVDLGPAALAHVARTGELRDYIGQLERKAYDAGHAAAQIQTAKPRRVEQLVLPLYA